MKVIRIAAIQALGLAAVFLPGPAFAEIDCTSPAFGIYLEDPKFVCEEVRKENLPEFGGITLRTVIAKGDLTATIGHPTITEKVKTALKAIAAIPAGMPLKINNVTIAVMGANAKNAQDEKGAPVLGAASTYKGECVLQLYPSKIVGDPKNGADLLGNTAAHELFHCVQAATWPAFNAVNYVAATQAWVVEGTAETVAQFIFPNIEDAFKDGYNFADKFRFTPLTQLTYPNLVFFSWVWNKSPALMFKILSAVAIPGDEAAQQKALLSVVSAADLSQFAQDFVDNKIHTPAGLDPQFGKVPLLMSTNIGGVQFDRAETRELVSQPFTLFALDAKFSGGKFDVAFENLGEIDWRHRQMQPRPNSADLDPKGNWTTGNFTTQSDCSTSDSYRFAGMAIGKAKLRVTTKVSEQESGVDCKSCGATAARDQCLVGTWIIDNTRMGLSIFEYLSGTHPTFVDVAGRNAIKFDVSGDSMWGYQNFKIGPIYGGGNAPPTSAILNGTIAQGWSASKGRLNTCFKSADARLQLEVIGEKGKVESSKPIDFNQIPRQDYEQYSYKCQDDGVLLIEKKLDGKPFLMRLRKVD